MQPQPQYRRIYWHPVYKYQLEAPFIYIWRHVYALPSRLVQVANDGQVWAVLYSDPVMPDVLMLRIATGYCWDGASGPAIDTPDAMRGSLVHDCHQQFISSGVLPYRPWKRLGDAELRQVLIEDDMPAWRAWAWWFAVRAFGGVTAPVNLKGSP